MGHCCEIECRACGKQMSLSLGIGMHCAPPTLLDSEGDFSLLDLLEDFPEIRARVDTLLREKHARLAGGGGFPWMMPSGYGHAIYRCSRCHRLHQGFRFCLRHDDGRYVPVYRCRHCRTRLKLAITGEGDAPVPHDLAAFACPSCGQHRLVITDQLLWD